MMAKNRSRCRHEYSTVTYRPSEAQKCKDYDIFVTHKWDIFSLGITILYLMDGKHPYVDECHKWHTELKDCKFNWLQFKERKYKLNLFLDQSVLDQCVDSSSMLNKLCNVELRDLVKNMIKDEM